MSSIIEIELDCQIKLEKSQLPERLLDQIRSFLTLPNPKYEDAEKHGYSTFGVPKFIFAYHEDTDYLYCFRGYIGSLLPFLSRSGLQYRLIDHRRRLPEVNFSFLGTLRGYQERAVRDTLKKDFGIAVAPCGAGKTVIGCAVIAARRQPTLIIVHKKELLNQWIDRIGQYLGLSPDEVGIIGNGKEIIKPITVGMVQTLAKRNLDEIREHFGQIIIDECHHTPCTTFTEVAASFDCQYMLGLSATPYRRDGLNKLIYLTLGNVSAEITDSELQQAGCRIKPTIVTRETDFHFDYAEDRDYVPMIGALVEDDDRNRLIVSDVIHESQENGNLSLVLSDRKNHCEALAGLLRGQGINCAVLTSDRSKKDREAIIKGMETGELRAVCATSQLCGEGLDIPKISRIYIATPVRFRGKVIQIIGRALRPSLEKADAKIFDYVDPVGILQSSYRSRAKVYQELN